MLPKAALVFVLSILSVSATHQSKDVQKLARQDSPKCLRFPCGLPARGCLKTQMGHQLVNGVLCPTCPYCVSWNVSKDVSLDMRDETTKCPALPCPPPAPRCAKFEWGHQWYHGKLCPTCQYCVYWNISTDASATLRDVHTGVSCPVMKCPHPGTCGVTTVRQQIIIDGQKCPGCLYCPQHDHKRDLLSQTGVSCPVMKCPHPGTCGVTTVRQQIIIDGQKCPGCLYCPQHDHKRDLLSQIVYCPDVMCADPGKCDSPQTSMMTFMGKQCPGCPYCPNKQA